MNFAHPLSDDTFVSAAVRVVLPWSMCPMVPTLTCGLVRVKTCLAMRLPRKSAPLGGNPAAGGEQRVCSSTGNACPGRHGIRTGSSGVPKEGNHGIHGIHGKKTENNYNRKKEG